MADENNMRNEKLENEVGISSEIDKLENDIDDIDNLIDEDQISSDPINWLRMQIANNADPRAVLSQLIPELEIPDDIDDISLWRVAFNIISEPPVRKSLPHINSLDHVKQLIKDCKNIIVLTGAGVSVSCGIPDFRSRDGIYARLSKDYPDLPDPQSMFDIHYFRINQWPFFKFAKEIYPGQFTPSLCHRFISYLDKSGRLLRNYSQNIDTLEQVAGIKNVVQCHGSFATATCMNCKLQVNAEDIKEDIFNQKIPYCSKCKINEEDELSLNVLKPDIVFFGESLPQAFHRQIEEDKDKADLLIVIGSSLKVRPVSLIPSLIKPDVPQILINREPLNHLSFDVELYGNCDDVIAEICTQLGSDWTDVIGDFVAKPLDNKRITDLFNSGEQKISDKEEDSVDQKTDVKCNENSNKASENRAESVSSDVNEPNNKNSDETKSEVDKNEIISNDDVEKGNLKRSCSCGSDSDVEVSHKKAKLQKQQQQEQQQDQNDKKEEIYYLSLPPNRYLFNGAEIDIDDDEYNSDTETEDNLNGEQTGSDVEETIIKNYVIAETEKDSVQQTVEGIEPAVNGVTLNGFCSEDVGEVAGNKETTVMDHIKENKSSDTAPSILQTIVEVDSKIPDT